MLDGNAAFTTITVETTDDVLSRDLRCVTGDVAAFFARAIATPPLGPKPLFVSVGACARCVLNDLPQNYRIHVTELTRDYCRFVYQVGHEIGHIYCDPYASNWLIETLCEMAAQVCLAALAKKWATCAPFPNWSTYAHNFDKHLERVRSEFRSKRGISPDVDPRSAMTTLLASVPNDLNNSVVRARNGIIAEALIAQGIKLDVLPVVGSRCRARNVANSGSLWDWLGSASAHAGVDLLRDVLASWLKAWPAP